MADLITSEVTGRNANVFYETSYAHGLGKAVVLLTRSTDDIPFDLRQYPHVVYGKSIATLKSELAKLVDTRVGGSYSQSMEVQLSPDQETELSRLSDQTGRSREELAREAVERYIAEETNFRTAVQAGLDAAARGEFVETSEVWARVERALKA